MSSTSATQAPDLDVLPAALPAMWRAVKRGFAAEPALLAIAFALSLVAALPDALMALWPMAYSGRHRTWSSSRPRVSLLRQR